MTSVMPRPFETIKWGLDRVQNAIEQSEGQRLIPQEALRVFEDFERSFGTQRNAMRAAMAQEIRWLHDGRSFPWAVEPTRIRYDETERFHLQMAGALQQNYRRFKEALDRADNNSNISPQEAENLKATLSAIQTSMKTLVSGVEHMREQKNNARPAYEILQSVKNIVNEQSNDLRGGPFGMWTKFGAQETQAFLDTLGWQVTDYNKQKEVIEMLFDTASSPYGNLVLDQASADLLKAKWPIAGIDWDKAVNAYKEEHPIVALYAVRIDEELNRPDVNVSTLEAMLNAGNAAVTELRADFVSGRVFRGVTGLSGDNLTARNMSVGNREVHTQQLEAALVKLRERIDQMRA